MIKILNFRQPLNLENIFYCIELPGPLKINRATIKDRSLICGAMEWNYFTQSLRSIQFAPWSETERWLKTKQRESMMVTECSHGNEKEVKNLFIFNKTYKKTVKNFEKIGPKRFRSIIPLRYIDFLGVRSITPLLSEKNNPDFKPCNVSKLFQKIFLFILRRSTRTRLCLTTSFKS